MKPLLERVRHGDVLVADGALGTLLLERGLSLGDCPEVWNLSRPEALQEIAAAYLHAGAEIIQTNTFGGSPLKLAPYGLQDRAAEINRRAVEAVRRAVGERAYVCGSCGPSGRIIKPYGDTEPEALYQSFHTQIRALVDAGVDVICVETMVDLTEATLAIKASRDISPATPVLAAMTFEATAKGFYTIMGTSVADAARGLVAAGADVIGSNCGHGIDSMVEIAAEFRPCSEVPLMIRSNAGLPKTVEGRTVYSETPAWMAARIGQLLDAGVHIIGGCCGTTTEHIQAIRQTVDSATQH